VVVNLLSNALRHTPSGGRIEVRTGTEGDDAVLDRNLVAHTDSDCVYVQGARAAVTRNQIHGSADDYAIDVDGDDLPEPASEDDLPRYTELDPHEEGERALYSTSFVARRLAARAGIGDDPGPPRGSRGDAALPWQ